MLAVDLFKARSFALSALTSICSFSTQGLGFVALPFLLQSTLGYSAVTTGLLMTPWPAVVAVMALIAGRLADRYPPGLLGGVGLVGAGRRHGRRWRCCRRTRPPLDIVLAHRAVRRRLRLLPGAQPQGA